MSFLEEIERAGKMATSFRRWLSTVETSAPMKATVGINGEMVFTPRTYLGSLNEPEFYAADRIDDSIGRSRRTWPPAATSTTPSNSAKSV